MNESSNIDTYPPLDEETKQLILDSCVDESTKVIRYLEEQQEKKKHYDTLILIITLIGAIGSVIAAITGILLFI